MPVHGLRVALLAAVLAGPAGAPGVGDEAAPSPGHWPSFRGAAAGGVAEGFPTPARWSVERGENVLWRTPIAGLGHSSPVVWGERIFVTSSISGVKDPQLKVGLYGEIEPVDDDSVHRYVLYSLNKRTGEVLWQRTVFEGVPQVKRHPKSSHANPTPATDGRHVVVFFGSEGLYCYDFDGRLLWKKDLGLLDSGFFRVPDAQWGFASSPVIHGDRVIVQCDVQRGSFLAALRLRDGEELWRTSRDEVPTWSTPTVHESGGRSQVIVNGWKQIGGYDLNTGARLWHMRGGGDIPVPTPVVAHDLIFITNAHGGAAPIYAVRTDARGDVTLAAESDSNEFVVWSRARLGAYMQTPLVYGDLLYVCRDNGVLSVYEARTGQRLTQARLGSGTSGFTASAVAADGKVYFTSELGEVYVLRAGPEAELVATNDLGEVTMATPAISEGVLYFRTRGHVVAIGSRPAHRSEEPGQPAQDSPPGS